MKKVKRQPIEGEKIFGIHTCDTGLIAQVYKELLELINKKTAQFKKGQRA